MSLLSFIGKPEIKARLKPLRPDFPRKLRANLKAEPRSNRYSLIGTAFDYFLRFELQRRAPHAVSQRWIAELAPDMIWRKTDSGFIGFDPFIDAPNQHLPPEIIAERARNLLKNAKSAFETYMELKAPNDADQAELAAHAIRLAKLDSVCRAMRLEPSFEEASSEDIQDLVKLLAIVPFDELLHDKLMLLNPNFSQSSRLVGGADADLIAGDLLIDFKTTTKNDITSDSLDQILGYLLLSRKQRLVDPSFPVINRLGLYYCRHGYLWSEDASVWTNHPEFMRIEKWFFERAKEVV